MKRIRKFHIGKKVSICDIIQIEIEKPMILIKGIDSINNNKIVKQQGFIIKPVDDIIINDIKTFLNQLTNSYYSGKVFEWIIKTVFK